MARRVPPLLLMLLALSASACAARSSTPAGTVPSGAQAAVDLDGPIDGLVRFPEPARDHDPDLRYAYEALPPHGGVHNPIWMNCGIYVEPIPPEMAVHSLEHGAIWITYREDLAEAAVFALQDLVGTAEQLLLSPYPNQRSPIVATSWAYQLELDRADDPRLAAFIHQFRNDPATAPEPGATCSGGFGDPLY